MRTTHQAMVSAASAGAGPRRTAILSGRGDSAASWPLRRSKRINRQERHLVTPVRKDRPYSGRARLGRAARIIHARGCP
jgi:hypothetical protein